MLTGPLLRFTFRNGRFFCRFIDPEKEENLASAAELLAIYSSGTGRSRMEIGELTAGAVQRASDSKFAAGLAKLLDDRAEFAANGNAADFPALRRELFSRSGALLKDSANLADENSYRKMLNCEESGDFYGDLPDFETLVSFRELTPKELLLHYNVALVQGLLLGTGKLQIDLSDPDLARLRKTVKFLKFFRLLAKIEVPEAGKLHMEISGPYALFENSRKYAMALASFFPAVLNLARYKVQAEITCGARKGRLELDESSRLVSFYRNLGAYVPEEIRMFHRLFKEKSESWQIVGDTPFLKTGPSSYCFPDLSFRNADGKVRHLELFHRWHKGELAQRLEYMEHCPDSLLIAGIDRSIADDEEFARIGEQYPKARAKLFRFRDFPGVETTLRVLERTLE